MSLKYEPASEPRVGSRVLKSEAGGQERKTGLFQAAPMANGNVAVGGGNALDATKLNIKWRQVPNPQPPIPDPSTSNPKP